MQERISWPNALPKLVNGVRMNWLRWAAGSYLDRLPKWRGLSESVGLTNFWLLVDIAEGLLLLAWSAWRNRLPNLK